MQRDVQGMAQVKLAGNIGRWNDNREDRARTRGIGLEITEINPALEPVLFGDFGIEGFAQFQKESRFSQMVSASCIGSDVIS